MRFLIFEKWFVGGAGRLVKRTRLTVSNLGETARHIIETLVVLIFLILKIYGCFLKEVCGIFGTLVGFLALDSRRNILRWLNSHKMRKSDTFLLFLFRRHSISLVESISGFRVIVILGEGFFGLAIYWKCTISKLRGLRPECNLLLALTLGNSVIWLLVDLAVLSIFEASHRLVILTNATLTFL